MYEVMAAVEDYRSACEAVPLQSPGYKRAEQQWEADMATTRKAVEQAVATHTRAELEAFWGLDEHGRAVRLRYWRALAGEQESARSAGGT